MIINQQKINSKSPTIITKNSMDSDRNSKKESRVANSHDSSILKRKIAIP